MDKFNRKHLILFDVGAVLLELDYSSFYESASKLGDLSKEKFSKDYLKSNLESDAIVGAISPSEYISGLRKILGDVPEKEIEEMCSNCWPRQINGVINLKKKLYNSGYSIGIFSNMSKFAHKIISSKFPEVFEVYDDSFPQIFSYKVGSMKPQTPMYEKINQGYDSVTFIDDKESYLMTGIEKFGWNGVLFTPYIDKSETIRNIHKDSTKPNQRFKVANSVKELEKSLEYFGLKFD